MKRAHDNVDDDYIKKRDGSPSGLRSQIIDRENESSRKSNCQEVNLKENKKQNMLQNNEITELHDSVITQSSTVNDNNDAPKSNGGYYGKIISNIFMLFLAELFKIILTINGLLQLSR